MADVISQRSLCVRAQVGCVIVTADNRVEAATYNGPAPAFDHHELPCTHWCQRMLDGERGSNYDSCPAGHAEANAIARSDWSHLHDAALFCSTAVCMNCAKLVTQTGIRRVFHRVYDDVGYRNPDAVEKYLREMRVEVYRV